MHQHSNLTFGLMVHCLERLFGVSFIDSYRLFHLNGTGVSKGRFMKMLREFYSRGRLSKELNETFLSFILKREGVLCH